ncbi:hypothetical protein [Naasia sp. SYSU D00948]|uniref:hypothetical protein n=1 Tax=Naasia sp. SYSU D00948 TaxID=2817379 RepID=UPI001B30C38F|nr:hypothetical protein [Naasia sp. SYSU D00948]
MRAAGARRLGVIALAVVAVGGCAPQDETSLPRPTPAGSPLPAADATITAPSVVPEVSAEIPTGPIVTPDSIAFAAGTGELYAPTDDGIVVIDVGSRQVVDRIAIEGGPGTILVDDGLVYVAEDGRGVGAVTVLYAATHEILGRIELRGTAHAGRMALDPSTSRLFVASGDPGVAVVDTGTREFLGLIPVGPHPRGVAVDPDLGVLFVSDGEGVTAIDTTSLEILDRFAIGSYRPLTGHGKLAVDEGGGMLLALNEGWGTVTVVDTATRKVLRVLRCGDRAPGGPFDIAVDPSARRAYVTGCRRWSVGVLDLATLTVVQLLRPADATPEGFQTLGIAVAVDPATGSVFLSSDGEVRIVEGG